VRPAGQVSIVSQVGDGRLKRRIWVGIAAIVIVLAAGGFYYTHSQTPTADPPRPRDAGLSVVLAIRTLERDEDTRLTKEQIRQILPFVKALKDVSSADEAGFIIAKAISDTFTPAQHAALEEARKRFAERQRQGGPPGAGGAGGEGTGGEGAGGAGGGFAAMTDEQRAQLRKRAFERVIRYLERRSR
jgi:hypothetical protein